MIYIFEDGRILYDETFLTNDDKGKYVAVDTLPEILEVTDKAGVITGCNLETKEIKVAYFDIPPEPEPIPEPIPQPTEQELLNAEFLLNQTEQSAKLKEIDEAIAVLLINQNGGM